MREVLPVARDDKRLCAGQGLEDLGARHRADEANTAVQTERERVPLQPLAVGPVADHEQVGLGDAGNRVERGVQGLLPGEPAGEDKPAALRRGLDRQRRGRVRHDDDSFRVQPPAERELGEVAARDDHVSRPPQRSRARLLEGCDAS